MLNNFLIKMFVTCGGVGFFKPGPGTAGTFLVLPVFVGLDVWLSPDKSAANYYIIYWGIWLLLFVLSLLAITAYQKDDKRVHDSQEIVIDEFLAVALVLPFFQNIAWWLLLAVFFRVFDIIKPFGIKLVDARVKNSLGVMLDDILAVILAAFSTKAVELLAKALMLSLIFIVPAKAEDVPCSGVPIYAYVLAPDRDWARAFFQNIECLGGSPIKANINALRSGGYEAELRKAIKGTSLRSYDMLLVDSYILSEEKNRQLKKLPSMERSFMEDFLPRKENVALPVLIDVPIVLWRGSPPPTEWQALKDYISHVVPTKKANDVQYPFAFALAKGSTAAGAVTGFSNAFGGKWFDKNLKATYSTLIPAIYEVKFLFNHSWRNLPTANNVDMLEGFVDDQFKAVQIPIMSLYDYEQEKGNFNDIIDGSWGIKPALTHQGKALAQYEVWSLSFPIRGVFSDVMIRDLKKELIRNHKKISKIATPVVGQSKSFEGLEERAKSALISTAKGIINPSSDIFRSSTRRHLAIQLEHILRDKGDSKKLIQELEERANQ